MYQATQHLLYTGLSVYWKILASFKLTGFSSYSTGRSVILNPRASGIT